MKNKLIREMVRIKFTERLSTGGAPSRLHGHISQYNIELDQDELDKIISGEMEWYCWMVDTKDEAEQLPTNITYMTFVANGLSIYRTAYDGILTVPRNELGKLLKKTKSAKNLNNNEECCPFELAKEFEMNAGSDEFWGWALVDTKCWWN